MNRESAKAQIFLISFSRLVCFCGLFIVLLLPLTVSAHGGGVAEIVSEPVGEMLVSVWRSPEPARVGTVHVTVGLAQAGETNRPILDQTVILAVTAMDNDSVPIIASVTHENATNKLFYEADFEVEARGRYRVDVRINDEPQLVSFELEVVGRSWLPWVGLVVSGLMVGGMLFVMRKG